MKEQLKRHERVSLVVMLIVALLVLSSSAINRAETEERDLSKVKSFEVFPGIRIPTPTGYVKVALDSKADGVGRKLTEIFLKESELVAQYVYSVSEDGNFLDGALMVSVPKPFIFKEVAEGEFALAVRELNRFTALERAVKGVDVLPSHAFRNEYYCSLVKEEKISSGKYQGEVYFLVSMCAFWHNKRSLFLLKCSIHGNSEDAIFTAGEQERFLEKWVGEIRCCPEPPKPTTISRPEPRVVAKTEGQRKRNVVMTCIYGLLILAVTLGILGGVFVYAYGKSAKTAARRGARRCDDYDSSGDAVLAGISKKIRIKRSGGGGRSSVLRGLILFIALGTACCCMSADDDNEMDGIGWNAWVDKRLGCMTKERANAFVRDLKILERERKAVSEGELKDFDLSKFVVSDVDSMNDLLNTITDKFGEFRYATCEAEFGTESKAVRFPSAGLLKISVNAKKKDNPEDVRMWLARVMAGLRYEDVKENLTLSKSEEDMWDDACVACSGFGGLTLVSVNASRIFTDDGERRQLSYVGSVKPVDAAWMYCIVALLRGEVEPKEIPNLSPAGKRAFAIGLHQAKVNLARIRVQMTSGILPEWDSSLPLPPPEEPVPRRKIKRTELRRPMDVPPHAKSVQRAMESLKGKVAAASRGKGLVRACLELAEKEKNGSANRFALVSEAMRLFAVRGNLDSAREVFDKELEEHGADYALALVDPILRSRRTLTKGKAGNGLAMWMAEVDEMKEAAMFLARNESELDYLDAPTFLRKEAAERYMILHDRNNAYEELYRSESHARKILWNMGLRFTPTQQSLVPPNEIADFWWHFADGKRPGVVEFCGKLSDAWYKRALESPHRYSESWQKAAKGRIGKWQERKMGFKTKAEAEFLDDEIPAGNSGLLVRKLEGAWPVEIPPLVPLVQTSMRGTRRTETRMYRPYDFWLSRAWVAGWADAFGNQMTLYRVKSLPLRDSDFDESGESRPTRVRLETAMDKSSLKFTKPSRDDLLMWISALLECTKEEMKFVALKTKYLRAAQAVTDLDGRPFGVLLVTKRGELYFADMRFPTVSIRDSQRLARRFAWETSEMTFPDEQRGDQSDFNVTLKSIKAGKWTVYPILGYLVWTDLGQETSKDLVWRIYREMSPVLSMFRRYVPPQRQMMLSTLRIFKRRPEFFAYMKDGLDEYGENMIGIWTARRQELLVLYDERSMDDTMATIRHEGFHQYLFYATGRSGHPMWFNEGHACFFENGLSWSENSVSRYKVSDGSTLRRTKELEAGLTSVLEIMPAVLYMDHDTFMSGTAREVNLRYTASWAVVYFLQQAVPALEEYAAYRKVIPTYLELMEQDSMRPEVATRKAWETVGNRRISADFIDFWRSPSKRAKARQHVPELHVGEDD